MNENCEHGLPRNSELRCLICLERYDPMNRKELIAECEKLRAENESLRAAQSRLSPAPVEKKYLDSISVDGALFECVIDHLGTLVATIIESARAQYVRVNRRQPDEQSDLGLRIASAEAVADILGDYIIGMFENIREQRFWTAQDIAAAVRTSRSQPPHGHRRLPSAPRARARKPKR